MEYIVQTRGSKHFTVAANGKHVGSIECRTFRSGGWITLFDGRRYEIKHRGIFSRTVQLIDGDNVVLTAKSLNWMNKIILYANSAGGERAFTIARKLFRRVYTIYDQQEHDLMAIRVRSVLFRMNHQYDISTNDLFEQMDNSAIILLMSLYCINYSMIISVMVATT